MKLEHGKAYKDRTGREWIVTYNPERFLYKFECGRRMSWTEEGKFIHHKDHDSAFDLVEAV